MTGGRVFVGFARGNTPRWTATFGQHVDVRSTESDKSEADQRNREVFYENWRIVKALWTNPTVRIEGVFWKVPREIECEFWPTRDYAAHTVDRGTLKEMGIVPRPLQQPHPPIYAPFSYSMETVRFWAREGGKMVSFVSGEPEKFLRIMLDEYCREAERAGRRAQPNDALAIGGHLVLGRRPAESSDILKASRTFSTTLITRHHIMFQWDVCGRDHARRCWITLRSW